MGSMPSPYSQDLSRAMQAFRQMNPDASGSELARMALDAKVNGAARPTNTVNGQRVGRGMNATALRGMNSGGGGRSTGSMPMAPANIGSSYAQYRVPQSIQQQRPATSSMPTSMPTNPTGINSSSRNNLDIDYTSVGGVDPSRIDQAMDYYLEQGLSPRGAAYLVGNYIQESRLDPNAIGDNGTAFGITQWRFDRRNGLPEGDYQGQLEFALREMDRDSPGVQDVLRNPNASDSDVRRAIQRWVRWGHEGDRWSYGQQIYDQLI